MKKWVGLGFVAFPLLFANAATAAVYEYTYTGPDFSTVAGSYTKSDNITGDFIVLSLLGNGIHSVAPLSYSFSDGVQTLNNSDSGALIDVTVSGGKITSWTVDIATGSLTPPSGAVISTTYRSILKLDSGTTDSTSSLNLGLRITNSDTKGHWSVAAVPEPSTWALMLLGFAGLAFAGHRRGRLSPAKVARD